MHISWRAKFKSLTKLIAITETSNYRMIIIYHKKKISITEVMVRTTLCRS